jgi:hypothetical protein
LSKNVNPAHTDPKIDIEKGKPQKPPSPGGREFTLLNEEPHLIRAK